MGRNRRRWATSVALLCFAVYLIMFIDSLLITPRIGLYSIYSYLFIAVLLVCNVFSHINSIRKIVVHRNPVNSVMVVLFIYYTLFFVLTLFSPMKEYALDEYLGIMKFLIVSYLTVYALGQPCSTYAFLKTVYYTASLILLYLFVVNGSTFNLATVMTQAFSGQNRIRTAFGFYNVNGIGNLAAMVILIGIVLWSKVRKENLRFRGVSFFCIASLGIVDSCVLLSTGSRNALVTIIGFFLSYMFMAITSNRVMSDKLRLFLRVMLIAAGCAVILWGYSDSIYALLESSYRLKGLTTNLPLLISNNRLFFGLGLFSPGLFGLRQVRYGTTFTLDSYYLYILLETGIVGFIIMSYVFISIAKMLNQSKSSFARVMLSTYIAWLISGLAETSVIYPKFPSSMVFIILFLTYIREEYSSISRIN